MPNLRVMVPPSRHARAGALLSGIKQWFGGFVSKRPGRTFSSCPRRRASRNIDNMGDSSYRSGKALPLSPRRFRRLAVFTFRSNVLPS